MTIIGGAGILSTPNAHHLQIFDLGILDESQFSCYGTGIEVSFLNDAAPLRKRSRVTLSDSLFFCLRII